MKLQWIAIFLLSLGSLGLTACGTTINYSMVTRNYRSGYQFSEYTNNGIKYELKSVDGYLTGEMGDKPLSQRIQEAPGVNQDGYHFLTAYQDSAGQVFVRAKGVLKEADGYRIHVPYDYTMMAQVKSGNWNDFIKSTSKESKVELVITDMTPEIQHFAKMLEEGVRQGVNQELNRAGLHGKKVFVDHNVTYQKATPTRITLTHDKAFEALDKLEIDGSIFVKWN